MADLKSWIQAFRLRTLPLSFSCILLGTFLALSANAFDWGVLGLSILTTLFIQILSNLANDYGDGIKGTDGSERIGPERAIQSGAITPKQMKRAIIIFSLLTFLTGVFLTYWGTRYLPMVYFWGFILVGLLAIWAAIQYTVGKKAYGYYGLGDLFVFIFFGIIGVYGSYFLHTNTWNPLILLPASSIGFLCVGVLNLNNMRDMESDLSAGKMTLAVKLGLPSARIYHGILLLGALVLAFLFVYLQPKSHWQWIFMISLGPILLNLRKVFLIQDPRAFDPLLKQLALSTLLFAVSFGLGQTI
ncbi:MAG: 1,4-dihydroxy-2-naphthoate polyprenyltransferase [Bacteroidota bacterium]